MKRRIAMWAGAGFLVAAFWVIYTFVAPPEQLNMVMREPAVKALAYASCPVAFAGRFFALSFWLVALVNAATYGMIGGVVETLRRRASVSVAV